MYVELINEHAQNTKTRISWLLRGLSGFFALIRIGNVVSIYVDPAKEVLWMRQDRNCAEQRRTVGKGFVSIFL